MMLREPDPAFTSSDRAKANFVLAARVATWAVIAVWLGHESPVTTHGYVEADLAMKEDALACVGPPGAKPTRYRPGDALLKFLEEL